MGLSTPPSTGTGSGAVQQSAPVAVSSADILSSFTTPVELIPAPGAGKWICVHAVVPHFTYGTTDYTLAGIVVVTSSIGLVDWVDVTSIVTASGVDSGGYRKPGNLDFAPYDLENLPVVLAAYDGDPTLGDSTMVFEIFYTEMTL